MQTFLSNISTISTWCYKKRKKITKLLEKLNNVPYFLNNSREQLLHQKGVIIWGKAIIRGRQLYLILIEILIISNILFYYPIKVKKTIMSSNKQNMGFLSVPNMVPWLIFRPWIIADQFCWTILTGRGKYEREDMVRCVGGDYSREAIIFNISNKGGWLFKTAVNRGTAIIQGNTVLHLVKSFHTILLYIYLF